MSGSGHGGLRGYVALLGTAERRHLIGGGLVARIPLAIVGFSVLFFVRAVTGSFADAGLASGVAIAASALSGPVFGRIADRRGQRGALLVAAIAHPIAVVLLILAGVSGQGLVVLAVAVLLVGGSIAPAGAYTRARWAGLVGLSGGSGGGSGGSARAAAELELAFSIEAVADELVWVFGPAVASLVAATIDPAAGLVLSGVIGTCGFLWLRRGAGAIGAPGSVPTGSAPTLRHRFVPWRSRRVMALLVSSVALGFTFGVNDVTVVAWATDAGVAEIAGLVLTVYSIGSVTGGVLMGAVPTRMSADRLLVLAAAAFGVFWCALALAPDVWWLFPLGLLAGATITPFTISTNRVLHQAVRAEVFTEAVAWVTACTTGAMSFGSFIGGVIGQGGGGLTGFDVVAMSAPLVVVVVAGARLLPVRRGGSVAT